MRNAFVEHGDTKDQNMIGSVTYKSDPELGRSSGYPTSNQGKICILG